MISLKDKPTKVLTKKIQHCNIKSRIEMTQAQTVTHESKKTYKRKSKHKSKEGDINE